jgi:hypothetical protein
MQNFVLICGLEMVNKFVVVGGWLGGGGCWVLKPILVFSFDHLYLASLKQVGFFLDLFKVAYGLNLICVKNLKLNSLRRGMNSA